MWDLNESPDQVHEKNESGDLSDRGKRVGARAGSGSGSISVSVSNSSSSAAAAAAATVNQEELASGDEEGEGQEVEAENEDEDAADYASSRKRSSRIFGFSVPDDDCPRPMTLQFLPVEATGRAEEEVAASAASSSFASRAFTRAHWAGVRFSHTNPASSSTLPSPDVSQPTKKSRRGPRSRSSQYRGVTFYRRTGRWESHIW